MFKTLYGKVSVIELDKNEGFTFLLHLFSSNIPLDKEKLLDTINTVKPALVTTSIKLQLNLL
jgi:hypothetical protein